jgi:hypothetical protein
MKSCLKACLYISGMLLLCLPLSAIARAATRQITPGPVPTQISTARRVFIANAGENQPFLNDPIFTGGQQRVYDEFYAGMKASGRYELAGAPADADLSFEIEMGVNRAGPRISQEPNVFGDTPYDPYFRLVVRDPKSNAILWVLIEHVQWAILQGNRDKNFDQAMERIISDVQWMARTAATNASTAKP